MTTQNGFAYLDHNVLNDMYEGQEVDVFKYLKDEKLQVVYSDQNLDEICDSPRRKDYFIDCLNRLGAIHINSPLDGNWKPTNQLNISKKKLEERIVELAEARESTESIGDGMELMSKFFGGNNDVSMNQIVNTQLDEVEELLRTAMSESPEMSNAVDVDKLLSDLSNVRAQSAVQMKEVDAELEANGSPFEAKNIKKHLGYEIKEISGVLPPKVIIKLWDMIGSKFGDYSTIEDYQNAVMSLASGNFGLKGTSELTKIQAVNDLYLWLNLVGFHRDEKIKRLRKMKGSTADMNHASYAMTCCSHFLCNDERLRYKAEAIYEHLNISTKIIDTREVFSKNAVT